MPFQPTLIHTVSQCPDAVNFDNTFPEASPFLKRLIFGGTGNSGKWYNTLDMDVATKTLTGCSNIECWRKVLYDGKEWMTKIQAQVSLAL